jgi:hypothetical protein
VVLPDHVGQERGQVPVPARRGAVQVVWDDVADVLVGERHRGAVQRS